MLTRRAVLAGLGALGVAPGYAASPEIIRPRAAWRAGPARPGGRPHAAARFALHHTAGPAAGSAEAPATLRGIQAFHQGEKGWIDVAYHVFVDADGAAWEGRDPALAGDTATDYDPAGFFLVCALGSFEEAEPAAAQVEGIAQALAFLANTRGLPLDSLPVHRDLASTLCPGRRLAARAPAILARARALASGG